MATTWIESSARGRHGGPIRAGMWGSVVIGTHPIASDLEVCLEVIVDDRPFGLQPAYWLENKGVNGLWHAPVPPQPVNARVRCRAVARSGSETLYSPFQDVTIRPNLPPGADPVESAADGLVGNRRMTVRLDSRGSTYDIYFPTVGLHSNVRPAEGDQLSSRAHFRAIVGGLAVGRRLDWFSERLAWDARQRYDEGTNILVTELTWRRGPVRVVQTDFAAMGPGLPRNMGGVESAGQYIKRFRIVNESAQPRSAIFGLYIHAEVNGGVGEPGLTWQDTDRCLLASNRGHGHGNLKFARNSTVEFAIALDDRGPVDCEPNGPNEAMVLRTLELPARGSVQVDVLVSGGFTGWRGDPGTFDHWLRPALEWFRSTDLDRTERATAQSWASFLKPLPDPSYPQATYGDVLRRSTLSAALHFDAEWGAVANSFDRGLNAYCWPRDAMLASGAMEEVGHPELGEAVFRWLRAVRGQTRAHRYWFHKYSIDGVPEWEAPAIDQTALIPWALERSVRRTGDLAVAEQNWAIVQQAASVCVNGCQHPALRWLEDLNLILSAGLWEIRYGAHLYSNAAVVAGLRSAVRLAKLVGRDEDKAAVWQERADRIWNEGILAVAPAGLGMGPGLVDGRTGRFLEGRRLCLRRGFWVDDPEFLVDRSAALDVAALALTVLFGLLPASDRRVRRTAQAILENNLFRGDHHALTNWATDPDHPDASLAPSETHRDDLSSIATLWMSRYLFELGRETGDSQAWNQAVDLMDAMIERLSPLGNSIWTGARIGDSGADSSRSLQGVWTLHGALIETMLDLAGLEHDGIQGVLRLRPVLPPRWPIIGLTQNFACGRVSFRLQRPVGGHTYQLTFEARLDHPMTLDVDVTCPGLSQLGPWQGPPGAADPRLDSGTGRLRWTVPLASGSHSIAWSWGKDEGDWFSGV